MTSIYEFSARDLGGKEQSFEQWRGKTLLIVNMASRCGFTPQYHALEALRRERREQGLVVLGFPCEPFGHQEPGDGVQIKDLSASVNCQATHGQRICKYGRKLRWLNTELTRGGRCNQPVPSVAAPGSCAGAPLRRCPRGALR